MSQLKLRHPDLQADSLHFDTLEVHAGEPRDAYGALIPPIYQTSTFYFDSTDDAVKACDDYAESFAYSRITNPSQDYLEQKLAALEHGKGAVAYASGMGAVSGALFAELKCGDHVIFTKAKYSGTEDITIDWLPRFGIEHDSFDAADLSQLEPLIRPNTRVIYVETPANPTMVLVALQAVAEIAHRHGAKLFVDNTFATPINCRPFEWGADIVVHSTTKYMDGHAGAIGGAIVDSGSFDWTKHPDKYPGLCTPDESYHGVTYTEHFGLAGAYITKATVQLMRDLGAIQSPQSAYYLNLGLESLHVRMKRHCENAQRVAEFLQQHENVSWVQFCGLPGDKYYELGQKYLPHGSCGVVSFGVKGGRAAAEAVMGRLKIASIETHVADSHTCCLHPASTTHRQMNAEELLAAGVREDLIRYSCGLEDAEDLIADLDQALQ